MIIVCLYVDLVLLHIDPCMWVCELTGDEQSIHLPIRLFKHTTGPRVF